MERIIERVVSRKVTARWGYADGHVEIDLKMPWPLPDGTHRIEEFEIETVLEVFTDALRWRKMIGNAETRRDIPKEEK